MLTVPKVEVENFNFSLPTLVAEEFRRVGDVHGERNKLRWAVATAAVLKLLEMPEEEMHALIRAVAGARHYPETLEEMVATAKEKGEVPPDDRLASGVRDTTRGRPYGRVVGVEDPTDAAKPPAAEPETTPKRGSRRPQ
jgi:hypothetical protein